MMTGRQRCKIDRTGNMGVIALRTFLQAMTPFVLQQTLRTIRNTHTRQLQK